METVETEKRNYIDVKIILESNLSTMFYGVASHNFKVGDILTAVKVTKEMAKKYDAADEGHYAIRGYPFLLHKVFVSEEVTSKDHKKYIKKIEKDFYNKIEEKKTIDKEINRLSRNLVFLEKKVKSSNLLESESKV